MGQYLLFGLEGLFQAWGSPLANDNRAVESRPTKSGVVGYLGACLGLTEAEHLKGLCSLIGFSCRVNRPGTKIVDFQSVGLLHRDTSKYIQDNGLPNRYFHAALNVRPEDRLALNHLFEKHTDLSRSNTIIGEREYLCGASFTACIWSLSKKVKLEYLMEHILYPIFQPFLGRKCCLQSAPQPQIIEARNLNRAYSGYSPITDDPVKGKVPVFWEGSDNSFTCKREHIRYDIVIGHRMFSPRLEKEGVYVFQ